MKRCPLTYEAPLTPWMKRRGFDRRITHVSSAHVSGKLGRPRYQGVTLEASPPHPQKKKIISSITSKPFKVSPPKFNQTNAMVDVLVGYIKMLWEQLSTALGKKKLLQ